MPRSLWILALCILGVSGAVALPDSLGTPQASPASPPSPLNLSFGVYAGYTSVLMDDVNKILKETEEELRNFGGPSANLANGGIILGGCVGGRIDRFVFGVDVSYFNVSGSMEFTQNTETLDEEIATKCWIFLGKVGYRVTERPDYSIDLLLGGGYGLASAEVRTDYIDRLNPDNSIIVHADLDGGRFAIAPEGVLHVPVGSLQLDFRGGYRFADMGVLKGPGSVNGTDIGETNLTVHGKDARFDLSGFFLTGGLSLTF